MRGFLLSNLPAKLVGVVNQRPYFNLPQKHLWIDKVSVRLCFLLVQKVLVVEIKCMYMVPTFFCFRSMIFYGFYHGIWNWFGKSHDKHHHLRGICLSFFSKHVNKQIQVFWVTPQGFTEIMVFRTLSFPLLSCQDVVRVLSKSCGNDACVRKIVPKQQHV